MYLTSFKMLHLEEQFMLSNPLIYIVIFTCFWNLQVEEWLLLEVCLLLSFFSFLSHTTDRWTWSLCLNISKVPCPRPYSWLIVPRPGFEPRAFWLQSLCSFPLYYTISICMEFFLWFLLILTKSLWGIFCHPLFINEKNKIQRLNNPA